MEVVELVLGLAGRRRGLLFLFVLLELGLWVVDFV
jgi:hypothetical protein